ncbi:hypothetical protein CHGG_07343 [Chaetomium globosum CBS 148.51]|jgi:FK506-binding protein 2|uniref:peptidylprolyl isomerase n=1 Tax=Chaetomium globosum (strain ATCC 6205 / CBS 148.51 / DSM 1962 / NBRC 6347 / NRRL 1970) TaxID=306901 RepID=Q2GXG1_CHAGB|nr:uncharacterized protein CHGG_07343 [Chaetomium globosum CBS 148.51]EAQ86090.1 hypothetical protein CHGG_07343 [Chaetomium globosum CBS 148.51]
MGVPQLDGLEVVVLAEGTGTRETKRGDQIEVHYTGTLLDGTKFDSSRDPNRGDPLAFKVGSGQVIKGWDEGLLGMKVGEKRKLTISPELAYGNQAVGPIIKANSTLVFDTELVNIK